MQSGSLGIGVSGEGTFNYLGGVNATNIAGDLRIAQNTGSSGAFNMSGGLLQIGHPSIGPGTGMVNMGESGKGTFNQSGGIHSTHNSSFQLGVNADGEGTYNLNNGILSSSTEHSYWGSSIDTPITTAEVI